VIKEYFLHYQEALANDFVLEGSEVQLLASDMDDWKITFLDTGQKTSIVDRLLMARSHIGDDEMFLATYGDGLTDAPLDEMIDQLVLSGKLGLFLSVRPRLSYHVVVADEDGTVRSIEDIDAADVRINGGFFVLRSDVFDHLGGSGEDIMDDAALLATKGALHVHRHEGFWAPMDTIKDKQDLDELVESGQAPWQAVPRARAAD
jgi:glucose-1-phosphate cytidylyltransferase